MTHTIMSGADIFSVGEIVPTAYGPVRILSRRTLRDYVVYDVEPAGGHKRLTIFARPPWHARLRIALSGIRDRVRAAF